MRNIQPISPTVLSITGTDNTGAAGIQADVKTITSLGAEALTAVTAVTVQDAQGIQRIHDLPPDIVCGQVKAVIEQHHPQAVKIGMVRNAATVRALRGEVVGCRHTVLVPGAVTSQGYRLLSPEAIRAWREALIPEAELLILRCNEAELFVDSPVVTDDDMLRAARLLVAEGVEAVLLRGGHQVEGQLRALLQTRTASQFFSSHNTEGWQRHGIGGALSSAITTCLALGDDLQQAISHAHDYLHSQVVYAVEPLQRGHRPADIYNKLMSLVATHYREAHQVAFYADRLAISQRYLSRITAAQVGKSPKQVVADYLATEATQLLRTSRLTVSEIAYRLGFPTLAAFSKFYAQQQGMSPSACRDTTFVPTTPDKG